MQSTIMKLQGQLRVAKEQLAQTQESESTSQPSGDGTELVCGDHDSPRHDVAGLPHLVVEDGVDDERTSLLHVDSSSPHRTSESTHSTNEDPPPLTDTTTTTGARRTTIGQRC